MQPTWLIPFFFSLGCGARTQLSSYRASTDAGADSSDASGERCNVLVFGGVASDGTELNDVWSWDGVDWVVEDNGAGPSPRDGVAMAGVTAGAMVLGGQAAGQTLQDAWLWQTSSFVHVLPPSLGRYEATLVGWQDGAVLFGGRDANGNVLGDTQLWSGTAWSASDSPSHPAARYAHTMVRLGDRLVMFGGIGANGTLLGDTWSWDGAAWAEQDPPSRPEPAAFAAIADQGGTAVLFGGTSALSGVVWGVTWIWDGATWTEQDGFSNGPSARSHHTMASLGDRTVLFGGVGLENNVAHALGDTWTWDGHVWSQEHPTTTPPPRYGHGTATVCR